MGIKRTLTRELVCDGCGRKQVESEPFEWDQYEDYDHFRSRGFSVRGDDIVCSTPEHRYGKRSCLVKLFAKRGHQAIECDFVGHDDKKIGTGENDNPIYKCQRCGREWESLNLKAANAALKTIYAPEKLSSLTSPFSGMFKRD